ncbi:MAG: folylpolyglutamate synthase/dihydrofolate synthase family protein [Acutalibacteraceae bacterium]|nr:folylpolyglutamate synthase/dihydrofolate synthase family protein [Acutalibacteraceae bacterium]
MTFKDAMSFISNRTRFKTDLSLSSLKKLMSLCGTPQGDMSFIHIAGTNGKGSVCYMLSGILQSAGYKTGLFVSPFVVEFCERIQINGEYISKSDFASIIENLKDKVIMLEKEGCLFTEFDLITAAALIYFKNNKCDYVVLEVGLGGKYDATNIIAPPVISGICHIDLDHQAVLGDSIEKIAQEKCGIIKKGTNYCVTYPKQDNKALKVISENAKNNSVELLIPTIENQITNQFYSTATIENTDVEISLAGQHQIYNCSVAVLIAKLLDIDDKHIKKGVKNTTVPARVEIINKTPLVILDGAHNTDGISALENYIRQYVKKPVTLLIGMVNDKDYKNSVKIIAPVCKNVITVDVGGTRALKENELCIEFKKYADNVYKACSTDDALRIINSINDGLPIVICGSLYLAADIRQKILQMFKK